MRQTINRKSYFVSHLPDSTVQTTSRVFNTRLTERGYIISRVEPSAEIGLNEAIENTKLVREISGDDIYPILVDIRKIRSISKEARDHFAMRDRPPGVSAIAMLVSSPLSRIIGNFFLGLNKPKVPTKMFTQMEAAEHWLLNPSIEEDE